MKNKFLAFLYLAATTLFLTSIYSCSVLAAPSVPDSVPDSAPESSQAHNPQGYTISGTFCFANATAVPSQSYESSETASRNAIPTTSSLTYSVTATRTSDNFLVNATLTPENKAYTFSNTLSAGTWLITAYGKRGDSIILQSPSKSITLSPSSPYASEDLFMTPAAGNGTVDLTISWETESGIGYCAYESSIPSLSSGNSGPSAVTSLNIQAATVATGTYELTLKFYKDASSAANSIPLYSCTEYVAVYSELTTDSWTSGTAPHISGTNFSVTEDCVKTFVYRKVYVSASGYPAGEATGTSERPFNTMEAAMARINEVASSLRSTMAITESNPWELHVIGTITAPSSFSGASFINVPGTITQLKILGEGSGATIDANSKARVLYISSGANVTIENITLTNGNASENGGGVYVDASGTFTMESGTITGNNATRDGGGVLVQSGATFNMKGGSITGNTATYAGGLTLLGTFNRQGGTISGNTSTNSYNANNIYIAASANGEFPTGGDNAFYDDTTTSNGKPDAICKITSNQFARFNNPGSGTSDFYSLVCSGSSFFNSSNLVTFYLGNTTDSSGKTWISSRYIKPDLKLSIICTSTSDDVKATIQLASTSLDTDIVYHNNAQEILLKKIILDGNNSARCINNQQGPITLESSTLTKGGGPHTSGAGLFISGGSATIDANSSITACDKSSVTDSQGGGVYISGASTSLTFSGKIYGCAAIKGGGIYLKNGSVTLKDNAVVGKSVTSGYPSESESDANKATNGAGVYVESGTLNMEGNSKVSYNYACIGSIQKQGGGIYVENGTVNIGTSSSHTASVCNNANSSGRSGGGIYIKDGTVNLYGSVKSNNCTGVDLHGGTLNTFDGAEISQNSSNLQASNLYGSGVTIVNSLATLNMDGGSITSNTDYDVDFTMGNFKMSGNSQAGKVCLKTSDVTSPGGADPYATIEITDDLTSSSAATIIPINATGTYAGFSYGNYIVLLGSSSLVAANCTKFAVADDESGNKWCVAADGKLCRLLQPDTSAVTITDPSQPWVVTSSNSKEITLKLQNTFNLTFDVTLRNLNKQFDSDCSALYIQNTSTPPSSSVPLVLMSVNLILEGDNTLIGSHHGGIQLKSNPRTEIKLTFDTNTTATLTFDGKPGTDGEEPTSLCVETNSPTIGIASGLTFSGSIGSTTYTNANAFFIDARSTTQSCTFTITRS
ncbi:MAG: hypothetical protein IKP51_02870 [Treponema sp.]|nr:hypothetical protein [Treponema sp.]